ncbi:DUF512 domain-containing protein [Halothermothrix orenii]|uniref:DUF512 domain-containing protein n=1 Tax=Halothermothrix orenii TaxID=31909 RepID=UPI0002E3D35B|nr:DUF512 domain-containing protein [Halothermothrix orenii]
MKQVEKWQEICLKRFNKHMVYPADEFYFIAGKTIPFREEYDGFPQLENGIGLTRLLWDDFKKIYEKMPASVPDKDFGIVTSELGAKALKPVISELKKIKGLNVISIPVINNFFGQTVNVTGLLTGQDIINHLHNYHGLP